MKRDILIDKSFAFAVRIVNLYKYLQEKKSEYVMSKQILRSGTNPGAMIRESKHAESDKDFIHKLSIAQKEISETMYWLELLQQTRHLDNEMFQSIHKDANEVYKLVTSSIITKKKNMKIL